MVISCPQCSTSLPESAAFCTHCGLRLFVGMPEQGAPIGLQDRILGALAYFTFLPALVFLVVERFKRDRYVKFHALQSLYLFGIAVVIGAGLRLALSILAVIPRIGYLLGWLTVVVTACGLFMLWMVLIVKALQGERFQLPLIGALAENSSSR